MALKEATSHAANNAPEVAAAATQAGGKKHPARGTIANAEHCAKSLAAISLQWLQSAVVSAPGWYAGTIGAFDDIPPKPKY